jgi:hypothetical protein
MIAFGSMNVSAAAEIAGTTPAVGATSIRITGTGFNTTYAAANFEIGGAQASKVTTTSATVTATSVTWTTTALAAGDVITIMAKKEAFTPEAAADSNELTFTIGAINISGKIQGRPFPSGTAVDLESATVALQERTGTTGTWDPVAGIANATTSAGGTFGFSGVVRNAAKNYQLLITATGYADLAVPITLGTANITNANHTLTAIGATISNVTIAGRLGDIEEGGGPIVPVSATINTNRAFLAATETGALAVKGTGTTPAAGSDVTDWFNLPDGIDAHVIAITALVPTADAPASITIEFSGTPTDVEDAAEDLAFTALAVDKTKFGTALVDGGEQEVATNNNARFRILAVPDGPNSGNVIIWGDGANMHVGLDLTRERLVRQTGEDTIADFTTAILSYTNNKGRWTAVKTERQAFVGGDRPILSNLLNKGWSGSISVSTSANITDKTAATAAGVNRGEPALGTNRITFVGTINARPKFGGGTRYGVNYGANANGSWDHAGDCDDADCEGCKIIPACGDQWTLTARGQENVPANEEFLETVQIYLIDNADRKARSRAWVMYDDLNFEGTLNGWTMTGATARAGLGIKPLPGDGKVTKDNIVARTIAVANYVYDDADPPVITGIANYTPASREQRFSVLGHGRAPFRVEKPPVLRVLTLNLRKGFEVVGELEEQDDTDGNPNGEFIVDARLSGTKFTMTDKSITFLRPAGAADLPAITGNTAVADNGNNIIVRIAATARRPASMQSIIPVSLPKVDKVDDAGAGS